MLRPWPNAATRRRWRGRLRRGRQRLGRAAKRGWRRLRRAPWSVRSGAAIAALAALWLVGNGVVQVARKPTELFFPVSGSLYKTPTRTWDAYGRLFRRHATDTITADYLAALAQVEGSGNPVVRTYWRWSWARDPFEIWRPASSAVGMYQITDGTFERAKRLCIHDHVVVEEGPWYDWRSCWWNGLYFRVVPSHAIEMTSAFLDRAVSGALARHGIRGASLEQKQRLASIAHLCGTSAADRHAARGLALPAGLRCGAHDVRAYLGRVEASRRVFARLAAESGHDG